MGLVSFQTRLTFFFFQDGNAKNKKEMIILFSHVRHMIKTEYAYL